MTLIFYSAIFNISKVKDKIYCKLSSNEAQGLYFNDVYIQGQLYKKKLSKKCVRKLETCSSFA